MRALGAATSPKVPAFKCNQKAQKKESRRNAAPCIAMFIADSREKPDPMSIGSKLAPESSPETDFVLSTDVAAAPLLISEAGDRILGPIVRLPAGSRVTFCGEGFNARTVKVRCEAACYFVFRDDLTRNRTF